ncbi:CidA/LrgA family protein [Clostridium sp. DJ247]|uniref:CidA/LrgA family protein n=1 Tax=Clostridium sp. DJ247 TaxID=2726188 RepID=UPI001627A909|nr:CidA/LrgA family protein [Clostridium sp. DJ247]MBC2581345.1 CidA/LrgA family protein [Clostridium sp. DJ247]
MKMIRQFAIVLLICFLGELLRRVFNLTIPGNVLGMILLLILLCSRVIKLELVEDISNFLLDHLSFFFVPAGVGLITSVSTIKDCWQYLILIVVISTVVVMAITGITVQLFKRS